MSLNLRSTFIASQAKDDKIIVDCCLVRGFVFFFWLVGWSFFAQSRKGSNIVTIVCKITKL